MGLSPSPVGSDVVSNKSNGTVSNCKTPSWCLRLARCGENPHTFGVGGAGSALFCGKARQKQDLENQLLPE